MERRYKLVTVCEKCGARREHIPEECPACHFRPRTLRELGTAALLTEEFAAGGGEPFGTPREQLEQIAANIREGRPIHIDEAQLARHEGGVNAFLSAEPNLPNGLYQVFRPAILLILVLVMLWLLLRWV